MGVTGVSGYQLKRIPFVPAKNLDAHSINAADLGLLPLNDPIQHSVNAMGRPNGKLSAVARKNERRELFKESDITMTWNKMRRVGSGLFNLGNTCFMNSVLQCLLHTAPLAELLLSGRQLGPSGDANGFDPIAITRQLLMDSLSSRREYVSPQHHAKSLKRINRSFKIGRQEDAHEYLIALLDAMHERTIAGMNPKPPPEVEFTSFVYRIFGGRIRSQVKCTQCSYESNTYDPFLDLSLEINHAQTVQRALQRFTTGEALDGANKYKCPKQNRPVRAVKRITIEEAPRVLIVQLKRFEFSLSGRKISRPVDFDEALDLSPFMSHRPATPALYDLYGVLVHQGHSMHSGHYYCFLKGAGGGEWHKFDDTRVHTTSARNVLGQLPYILFYIQRTSQTAQTALPQQPAALAESRSAADRERALRPASISKNKRQLKRSRTEDECTDEDGDGTTKKQSHALPPEEDGTRAQWQSNEKLKRRIDEDEEDDAGRAASAPYKSRHAKNQRQQTMGGTVEGEEDARAAGVHMSRHRAPLSLPPAAFTRLGRRGKRLAEQKMMLASMLEYGANHPSPPPKRPKVNRYSAPLPQKAADIAASKREKDHSVDDTDSLGSAIPAPDWPPVKPALGGKKASLSTDQNAHVNKRDAVKKLLNGVGAHSLGVDVWEDMDVDEKRRHDRLLRLNPVPGRRAIDEYDAEYDRGRVKKAKSKDRVNDTLDSRVFDAAVKSKKPKAMQQVQLRGKKRQRQLRRGT